MICWQNLSALFRSTLFFSKNRSKYTIQIDRVFLFYDLPALRMSFCYISFWFISVSIVGTDKRGFQTRVMCTWSTGWTRVVIVYGDDLCLNSTITRLRQNRLCTHVIVRNYGSSVWSSLDVSCSIPAYLR